MKVSCLVLLSCSRTGSVLPRCGLRQFSVPGFPTIMWTMAMIMMKVMMYSDDEEMAKDDSAFDVNDSDDVHDDNEDHDDDDGGWQQ